MQFFCKYGIDREYNLTGIAAIGISGSSIALPISCCIHFFHGDINKHNLFHFKPHYLVVAS